MHVPAIQHGAAHRFERSRNAATTPWAEVAIAGGAVLYLTFGGRLCCLGPAFGQTQDASTRGTTFALSRPGLTFCLDPITRQARATRRDQHRAHPVWPPRDRIRLGVDQEWLTHPIPSHEDLFIAGIEPLRPEIADVTGFAELRIGHGDSRVSKFGIDCANDGRLQPTRQRNIV